MDVCKVSDKRSHRAMAIVPFMAVFDPWIEFLGSIRDKQFAKL